MKRNCPSWGAYEKNWMRFVMTYRLGDAGKASRKVTFKKASYLVGNRLCKPFRKM